MHHRDNYTCKAMKIDKIDPPYWFAMMCEHELHLLVYGEDLLGMKVKSDLTIISVKTYSHYAIIVVNVENVPHGTYSFTFTSADGASCINKLYRILPRRKEMNTPISTADVVYLAMPDRFAKSTSYKSRLQLEPSNPNHWHGGNIRGIIEQLDYLQKLGITALWLTPVFDNSERKDNSNYHGYAITDFYNVDAHLGIKKQYRQLVKEAHQRGIKVIKDIVLNHCGIDHPWKSKRYGEPQDDWFNNSTTSMVLKTNYDVTTVFNQYISEYDKDQTVKGWFTEAMPDINLTNAHVLHYFYQVAAWWIETADIDAFRVDTYLYADFESVMKWQNMLHKDYPSLSIIAETWVPQAAYTAKIQQEVMAKTNNDLTIIMDFAFQKSIEDTFKRGKIYDKEALVYHHLGLDFLYNNPKNTLAFLDNHDLMRCYKHIKTSTKLKQALVLLLTLPRIPQIQYGTELLFAGTGDGVGDGDKRQDMFGKFNETNRTEEENDMLSFTQNLLAWRKQTIAVHNGNLTQFRPNDGIYVYFRESERDAFMVAVNLGKKKIKINLECYSEILNKYIHVEPVICNGIVDFSKNVQIVRDGVILLNLKKS